MKDLMKPYSKTPDLTALKYPVIATPKYDGIRCAIENGVIRTFNKKPVPNKHINDVLKHMLHLIEGFDGELIVPGVDFNGVQSAVMAEHGKPKFIFVVFDLHDMPGVAYKHRIEEVYKRIGDIQALGWEEANVLQCAKSVICNNPRELNLTWQKHIDNGYEGTIAANPSGYYKNGRSGIKEQLLVKLKVWHDDEAVLIDIEEEVDGSGQLKGTTGCLIVRHSSGAVFGVAGLTADLKHMIWHNKQFYIGKTVTFKYQDWPTGGNPRFPGFKGFRYA